jgi:hypothetical protein
VIKPVDIAAPRRYRGVVTGLVVCIACAGSLAWAQQPETPPAVAPEPPVHTAGPRIAEAPRPGSDNIVSLKVQIVLSRFEGERKISSLPYALTVNTSGAQSMLRIGAQVPIATATSPVSPVGTGSQASVAPQVVSWNYQHVGTDIDCRASDLRDGRFSVVITIGDSSVYPEQPKGASTSVQNTRPSFRSFQSTQAVILTDGQTLQYTAATDKVTGEVVKVDVTLNVLK